MIVRNEEHTLRSCLASVAGLVSQIVIADTGSTDNTPGIAREFGATVIPVPWENHFANARNAALERARTDWVLVLDADEELDRRGRIRIPKLIARASAGGYLIPIRNYVPTATGRGWDRATQPNDHHHPRAARAPAFFVHENCRLFRRDPQIYFVGRVHELVEPRIDARGLTLPLADFCIHHFGQLNQEESRGKKAAAYLDLLRLKVQELPDDPMAWLQLGLQEFECSRKSEEPLRCFERALALEPRATSAWLFKGMIHLDLGDYSDALAALEFARSDRNSQALCEHLRGDALHNLGRLQEARVAYAKAVQLTRCDPVLNSKLGYTEVRLGQVKAGISKMKDAANFAPETAEIRERLMKACIVIDDLEEAARQAEKLASLEKTPKAYLRAASIRVEMKSPDVAIEILDRATNLFPDAIELRRALSELGGQSTEREPAIHEPAARH
jgi:glycosyltransferase involved in cell wall biosynthesis